MGRFRSPESDRVAARNHPEGGGSFGQFPRVGLPASTWRSQYAAMIEPRRASILAATLLQVGGMLIVGAAVVGLAASWVPAPTEAAVWPTVSAPPPPPPAAKPEPVLQAQPITDAMRHRGIHECNPPDPLGLGPYAPYRHVSEGRIAIPQQGGHTDDLGFDVLVHFHGADPVRKTVVQVARGIAYVAVDKGVGSGAYADAFLLRDRWPRLKESITNALRAHTGDERAHIRRLGLSSWSAGYGAVNQIVKQDAAGIDAVILLDSLHGSWKYGTSDRDHGRISSVDLGYIAPLVGFAERAQRGEKLFVLTHSRIDPREYPGVGITADALLDRLGEQRQGTANRTGILTQVGSVDTRGLHVWSYDGRDERAHCAHIAFIARALTTVVEPAWETPPMDRDVPPTPGPLLGGGGGASAAQGDDGAAPVLEPAAPDGSAEVPSSAPVGSAPQAAVDTAGLIPQPLAPAATVQQAAPTTEP